MARPTTLRVMISSRSQRPAFARGPTLVEVRRDLKQWLEAEPLFGVPLFEVFIHEDAPPGDSAEDAWERSLREIRRADLVLVLFNGEAGWAVADGDVGICHAELAAARDSEPGKVFLVQLDPLAPLGKGDEAKRDSRFRGDVAELHPFSPPARTPEEVRRRVADVLREGVASLARLGVAGSRRGRWAAGQALAWSRLDLVSRKAALESAARDTLLDRHGVAASTGVVARIADLETLLVCHGLPASASTAAARELVGQPFLRDHELVAELAAGIGGPVHVVLCHRTALESQALRLLGHPDATVVSTPFGVYLADEVQKVQVVFIAQCRDRTTTRHGVQRLFVWLDQAEEAARLAARAQARRRIADAIAAAQGT
jgi:hypothetical protein